jgi:hypothetical protein
MQVRQANCERWWKEAGLLIIGKKMANKVIEKYSVLPTHLCYLGNGNTIEHTL